MFELTDWIGEPKFFKEYLNMSPGHAAAAAFQTRSKYAAGQDGPRQTVFSAFAWRI